MSLKSAFVALFAVLCLPLFAAAQHSYSYGHGYGYGGYYGSYYYPQYSSYYYAPYYPSYPSYQTSTYCPTTVSTPGVVGSTGTDQLVKELLLRSLLKDHVATPAVQAVQVTPAQPAVTLSAEEVAAFRELLKRMAPPKQQ